MTCNALVAIIHGFLEIEQVYYLGSLFLNTTGPVFHLRFVNVVFCRDHDIRVLSQYLFTKSGFIIFPEFIRSRCVLHLMVLVRKPQELVIPIVTASSFLSRGRFILGT